jgi:tRNA 2-selenouridine synthase
MVHEVDIDEYLRSGNPLIDVRSPGEYKKGHIPGAINIPLFSDTERARVGTVYKRQSKEKAMSLGYKYVEPRLEDFIVRSKQAAPQGRVTVYCARGGLRSGSFAGHLRDNGFSHVSVISGGYKAYRKHASGTFDIPFNLRILGGYTGSGKTPVLHELIERGHQVVDLEGLAMHRGSAFGAIDQQEQPTSEQFQNNLFDAWRKLDYSQPVWLEDESHNIGGVVVPYNLITQMRKSALYFLDVPKEARARHLVSEYADVSSESLAESIHKISKRLGQQNTIRCLRLLEKKNYHEVALLALSYYDKSYTKAMRYRKRENVFVVPSGGTDPVRNADLIITLCQQHKRDGAMSA